MAWARKGEARRNQKPTRMEGVAAVLIFRVQPCPAGLWLLGSPRPFLLSMPLPRCNVLQAAP